jgi:CheY-like chemotaxis protein
MANEMNGKTVVLCEDEAIEVLQLKMLLEREGFRVVSVATDGRESVDHVLRERPDIVIMDINLPNMDGIEATRRIMSTYHTYRPCIVMVTAYDDDDHRMRSLAAGACGYVTKPFSPQGLVEQIKQALESAQGLEK